MAERCAECAHLSTHDTELPVCRLHRRFMHEEWTCNDFEHVTETIHARYESEPSEDDMEVR